MTTLIPASSACHHLQLPPTEIDDRLNLNVRTGSASVLYNSFVFTYGGLTIGLDLDDQVTIHGIIENFLLRVGMRSKRLRKYLSDELFYLDLILKVWKRVDIPPGAPKPKPRLFHELAKGDGCIYVFGGLVVPDGADEGPSPWQLVPCNDLWEFKLTTSSWRQLHDGSGWQVEPSVPAPRFCHKMTPVSSLSFSKKKDHGGLMVAGGLGSTSGPLYDNVVFDLVDEAYVVAGSPLRFYATTGDLKKDDEMYLNTFTAVENHMINVNYLNSIIVNFKQEVEYHHPSKANAHAGAHDGKAQKKPIEEEESIIIYSPTVEQQDDFVVNPLLSFRMGKKFGRGKVLSLHKKKANTKVMRHTIPLNLRYPTGGLFGQNLVITGFLPNDFDISIFIYNKPTGKWSRLNVYCNHDYGSHRFWGGFAWTSHHKVILLGNFVTSRTTSSVRYFSSMITVSLPVTNILASSELAGDHMQDGTVDTSSAEEYTGRSSLSEDTDSSVLQEGDESDLPDKFGTRKFSSFSARSDSKGAHNSVSFSEYVRYAAPKINFTKVRSIFPPAAITLGRNAFDRYGDLISDFELISCNGDRLPVSSTILLERWGTYFVDTLSRAYVSAVDKFEAEQNRAGSTSRLRSSKSSGGSTSSRVAKSNSYSGSDMSHSDSAYDDVDSKTHYHLSLSKYSPSPKEAPQFRLPFQDGKSTVSINEVSSQTASIDPHKLDVSRKNSSSSMSSGPSLLASYLQEIPPQLPLPNEPIPAVPTTPVSFRSTSRKNSHDGMSPRASIMHTLTALRNIPANASPFTSPRGSVSASSDLQPLIGSNSKLELTKATELSRSSETPSRGSSEPEKASASPRASAPSSGGSSKKASSSESVPASTSSSAKEQSESSDGPTLLDFTSIDPATYRMEPSLIPRKLYIPFGTNTLKAFCEYLYTGQVGNKWSLKPCAIDCMIFARYFRVPLLYDLLCEVLYGIIGRKETLIVKEGNRLKKKIAEVASKANLQSKTMRKSPLDEYEGFMDTVDDGYLDIALLRKSSSLHKASISTLGSGKKKYSTSLGMSFSGESDSGPKDYFERTGSFNEVPVSPRPGAILEQAIPEEENSTDNSGEDDIKTERSLHYLDYQERRVPLGPRSRSVFDRSLYDSISLAMFDEGELDDEQERSADLTLEQLVSPDSPEPSNYVIDVIHETASMCTDVKLMLRTMNVRHMVRALKQTKEEYERLCNSAKVLAEQNKDTDEPARMPSDSPAPTNRPVGPSDQQSHVDVTVSSVGPSTPASGMTSARKLEPSRSTSSLIPAPSIRSDTTMSRNNTGLKFPPFKSSKSEVNSNKQLDKRITQMIKNDEKMMQRQAKERRVLEKRKTSPGNVSHDDYNDSMSIVSRNSAMEDPLDLHSQSGRRRVFRFSRSKKEGVVSESNPISRSKLATSLSSAASGKTSASAKTSASVKTSASGKTTASGKGSPNQKRSRRSLFGFRKNN